MAAARPLRPGPRAGTDYPSSLSQFLDWFQSDADCVAYLVRLRWPDGFSCPNCGPSDAWLTKRHLYVCAGCGKQTSITAGTIFEKTRLPLLTWFRAIWMLTSSKSGVSAKELERELGVSYRARSGRRIRRCPVSCVRARKLRHRHMPRRRRRLPRDEGALMALPADFVDRLFRLDGRVAAVTGGGSGLGAAMAAGLAQAGARVAVIDIDQENAEGVVAEIASAGGEAKGFTCDVTDSSAVDELVAAVAAKLGVVQVLVNSAGSAFRSPAEDFPEDKFDFIVNLNLKGTFLPCQRFGKHMLAGGGGSIINVASIGGFIAYPHASAYLSTKGAVVQLTRSLALEWIGRIRVNAIAPTVFETPLTQSGAQQSTVTSDFIQSRLLREGRLGQPEEIVGAAIFLASDASSFVTGHTLPVDDGYLIA